MGKLMENMAKCVADPNFCLYEESLRRFSRRTWRSDKVKLLLEACLGLARECSCEILEDTSMKRCNDPIVEDAMLNVMVAIHSFGYFPTASELLARSEENEVHRDAFIASNRRAGDE